MFTFQFVEKFVKEHFEDVSVKGNQITARCLLCGDSKKSRKKKRFNLLYKEDSTVFHCFNCEASGSFLKLYALIKKSSLDQAYQELHSLDSIKNRLTTSQNNVGKVHNSTVEHFNDILNDCLSEDHDPQGIVDSALLRILDKFKAERFILPKLYICFRGKYANRIIIPVTDKQGNIIYFQARALFPSQIPKYLNPTAEKSLIIPNFHNLKEPVIVTEGLLDSFMVGEHGTCCLGKEISEEFLEKLKTKFSDIIIALDNDKAGYESMLKFFRANKYARQVKYFLMPKLYANIVDLNQLKVSDPGINILELVVDNTHSPVKAEILLKMDKWRFEK